MVWWVVRARLTSPMYTVKMKDALLYDEILKPVFSSTCHHCYALLLNLNGINRLGKIVYFANSPSDPGVEIESKCKAQQWEKVIWKFLTTLVLS